MINSFVHKKPKRSEQKKMLKHTVTIVDLVDRLSRDETDPEKIQLLNQLRKEVKKYGSY